jgi:hypothetical protein
MSLRIYIYNAVDFKIRKIRKIFCDFGVLFSFYVINKDMVNTKINTYYE